MKNLLMIALVLTLAVPAVAETTYLTNTGDTYIDSYYTDDNQGQNALYVGDGRYFGLLRFDTLPADFANATINSATLNLARLEEWGNTPGEDDYIRVHQITDTAAWQQGYNTGSPLTVPGATWNHADGFTDLGTRWGIHWDGTAHGTIPGATLNHGSMVADDQLLADTDNALDVTSILQNWADGQLNNGMILTADGESVVYASLEYNDTVAPTGGYGDEPYIYLDYTPYVEPVPFLYGDANGDGVVSAGDYASVQANFGNTAAPVAVPEPATMSLLVLGGVALIRRKRK